MDQLLSNLVAFIWLVTVHWGAYVTGSAPILADGALRLTENPYKRWAERNGPIRRWVVYAFLLGGILFASFQAWQEEHAARMNAETSADTNQMNFTKQKQRADDFDTAINGKGGYKDQITALQNVQKSSAPPTSKAEPLTRMIAYRATDLSWVSSPSQGSVGIEGVALIIANVGNSTIDAHLVRGSMTIDGREVISNCTTDLGIIAQTTDSAVYLCKRPSGETAIARMAKQIAVDLEVKYDTIPTSGVRTSYRRFRYDLNWNDGGSVPTVQKNVVAQWEK